MLVFPSLALESNASTAHYVLLTFDCGVASGSIRWPWYLFLAGALYPSSSGQGTAPLSVPLFLMEGARCLHQLGPLLCIPLQDMLGPYRSNTLPLRKTSRGGPGGGEGGGNQWAIPEVTMPTIGQLPKKLTGFYSLFSSPWSWMSKAEKATSTDSFSEVWGRSASLCNFFRRSRAEWLTKGIASTVPPPGQSHLSWDTCEWLC